MHGKKRVTILGALTLSGVTICTPALARTPSTSATAQLPTAVTGTGAATSAVHAVLKVAINAFGALTRYYVQYGPGTNYADSTSIVEVSVTSQTTFEVTLTDLTPSTIYHYRVVATNLVGTTYGDDETFATWPVQIPFHSQGIVSENNIKSEAQGSRTGKKPRGWVLIVHGGGWQAVGRAALASENNTVRYVTGLGWAAYNVDYRKGEHSLPDVLAAYDKLRKKVGSRPPICLVGHSAGGNLALLVAEQRRTVACVISEAGPSDLVHFARQHAYPTTAQYDGETLDPAWAFEHFMVTSFGARQSVLRTWSPVHNAGKIRAAVLVATSSHDTLVPLRQMTELRIAMRENDAAGSLRTIVLHGTKTAPGEVANFTHASVTAKALRHWQRAERRILARSATAA